MKWTVKLIAEVVDGKQIEHEIATIERADGISPATVGLTIAEGKGISGEPAEGNRHGAGSTSWCQHSIVSTMRKGISHEGLLSVYSSIRLR